MEEVVLGIDFGTSNTCVSVVIEGAPVTVQNSEGAFVTPTCVGFDQCSRDVLIGTHQSHSNVHVVSNIKRLLGIPFAEYQKKPELQDFFQSCRIQIVNDVHTQFCAVRTVHDGIKTDVSVSDIAGIFATHIVSFAKKRLMPRAIKGAVLTVPSDFLDIQKEELRRVFENAGIDVLRIMHEPTAAALANGAAGACSVETILVVDCGGGTTDFSVVCMDHEENVYEVKNTYGLSFLGGEDITRLLVDYVLDHCNLHTLNAKQMRDIKEQCEIAKRQLSYVTQTTIVLDSLEVSLKLTRSQLDTITKPFFDRIRQGIQDTAEGYRLDRVVFVGGSTRMPQFAHICKTALGNDVVLCDIGDPDHVVSNGAAIQGSRMHREGAETDDILLIDVVPMSLGIETTGGIVVPIVSKNTPIPTTRSQVFTNANVDTESLSIDVFGGERKFAKDNTHLATFRLEGLDKTKRRGEMAIKVTFEVDADGMLSATAEDCVLNKTSSIKVKKTFLCQPEQDLAEKILDSRKERQIEARQQMYETFLLLLTTFHTRVSAPTAFQRLKLNEVFNQAFEILANYHVYDEERILNYRDEFSRLWHTIMFSGANEGGSTKI